MRVYREASRDCLLQILWPLLPAERGDEARNQKGMPMVQRLMHSSPMTKIVAANVVAYALTLATVLWVM